MALHGTTIAMPASADLWSGSSPSRALRTDQFGAVAHGTFQRLRRPLPASPPGAVLGQPRAQLRRGRCLTLASTIVSSMQLMSATSAMADAISIGRPQQMCLLTHHVRVLWPCAPCNSAAKTIGAVPRRKLARPKIEACAHCSGDSLAGCFLKHVGFNSYIEWLLAMPVAAFIG